MSVTVCISHKEDVDGIASAALIGSIFKKTRIILVDYANMINKLKNLVKELPKNQKGINRIFICDLGLNKKNEIKFIDFLSQIIKNGYKVTYIDHHDIAEESKDNIIKTGANMIHSINECTSVQVYEKYKKKMKALSSFLPAAGALTDYMENRPLAKQIISKFDRQFLMLESTALSYIISANQNNEPFLNELVLKLSDLKYTHEIEDGFDIANQFAKKVWDGVKSIQDCIKTTKNLAYVQNTLDLSSSTIVNFVLGISEKDVAMVFKFKEEINSYIISIRGSQNCETHLGRLVNEVAARFAGSGGGHEKACGAVIPDENFHEFIKIIDKNITVS